MKLSTAALATAAAGAIGLGVLVAPAGAGSQPALPDVSAEDLVASMLAATPPAFGGTVEVHNALGLPALPGMGGPSDASPLTEPRTTLRVWSDGQGRGRIALPSASGEQVWVEDGSTLWRYDSAERTATAWEHGPREKAQHPPVADPAAAAQALVSEVRESSTVTVDGTGEVADRPVYELVLAPVPTERTLLREVRVAVDAAERVPLRLTVLAHGSPEPALRIGFADLDVGAQEPELFRFTPPEGVTVERPQPGDRHGSGKQHLRPGDRPGPGKEHRGEGAGVRTLGEGWDTVLLAQLPAEALRRPDGVRPPDGHPGARPDRHGGQSPAQLLARIGDPVSGPWGEGWVVRTAVTTVLVAQDGRVAAGAVPQQVLEEALAR